MKNFWLRKRRSREMHEKAEVIEKLVQGIVNGKLIQHKYRKGKSSWLRKNGIKTRP